MGLSKKKLSVQVTDFDGVHVNLHTDNKRGIRKRKNPLIAHICKDNMRDG